MAYGTEGYINPYTGNYNKPIIRDLDKGGKNYEITQRSDTTTTRQVTSTEKQRLTAFLSFPIPKNIITKDDITNTALISKYKSSKTLDKDFVDFLPLQTINKILNHFNIDSST